MTTNDGGPAYPSAPDKTAIAHFQGMSLRDYFAGQAMAGLTSGSGGGTGDTAWFEQIGAPAAYRIADAMIKARGTTHDTETD